MENRMDPKRKKEVDEEAEKRKAERYGTKNWESNSQLKEIVELAAIALEAPVSILMVKNGVKEGDLLLRKTGHRRDKNKGKNWKREISESRAAILNQTNGEKELEMILQAGNNGRNIFYAGHPIVTKEGNNLGELCVIDTRHHQRSKKQERILKILAKLATHEIEEICEKQLCPTTGVFRKNQLLELGQCEYCRSRKNHQPLAVIEIDIDNFSLINQKGGHESGNDLLAKLCKICSTFLQKDDLLCRYEDEEFSIILVDTPTKKQLQ